MMTTSHTLYTLNHTFAIYVNDALSAAQHSETGSEALEEESGNTLRLCHGRQVFLLNRLPLPYV